MTAAVGEKRDLFVAGAGRGREDLPGLSRHTNAAAHVLGGQTVDRELPDVGLQLHAADRPSRHSWRCPDSRTTSRPM